MISDQYVAIGEDFGVVLVVKDTLSDSPNKVSLGTDLDQEVEIPRAY